ncbi:hypothetical protein HJC23_004179 [Cyclotella cryptica]|uniref:Urease accessory protein UreD n=1 Tax=Cyclotella cryptica TaxID=29204 RepID=A0ABD3Q8G7_9STRA|eukprot:CCRYP_007798-RA/>CCRYP_007798-RA protein AED:0.00 eAED:0.00 QI:102/1/1/1/0/0/2/668/792
MIARGSSQSTRWPKGRCCPRLSWPFLSPTNEKPSNMVRQQTRLGHTHQRGHGKIVATSSKLGQKHATVSTHLTELSHSSPMRLVPSRRSHPAHVTKLVQNSQNNIKHEAAIVHLSSYGGGFVPGDIIKLDVEVRGDGAIVYVLTQGGTRIYRPGDHFRQHSNYTHPNKQPLNQGPSNPSLPSMCESSITCTVEPGATLFFLPDPTVPYERTSFKEHRVFNCQYSRDENKEIPQSMGSIIAVDWYSSGRRHSTGMEEERWAFDSLSTRTELHVTDQRMHNTSNSQDDNYGNGALLIEAMTLDNTCGGGDRTLSAAAISMGRNHDSYATLLLHGPNSLHVATRATELSRQISSLQTRVRIDDFVENYRDDEKDGSVEILQLFGALGGKVLMSVTSVENTLHEEQFSKHSNQEQKPLTHMVRILAESNEDIYRVLHFCLKPCSHFLGGLEPYKDRIHSSLTLRNKTSNLLNASFQSMATTRVHQRKASEKELQAIINNLVFGKDQTHSNYLNGTDAWFHACLFSDSALPVGSFAHSLGIEAASQMGLFSQTENKDQAPDDSSCSVNALADYLYAVSRSNARFSAPIILAGYSLVANAPPTLSVEHIHESWLDIDEYIDKLLRSNGPARRASVDQGLGFLRIAPSLLERNDLDPLSTTSKLWRYIRGSISDRNTVEAQGSPTIKGHAAPIYGILAASLKIPPLDSCRVFSFGVARDTVSAAVRLNLLGPVAGLSLLDQVGRIAVEQGLEEGLLSMSCRHTDRLPSKAWLESAATCAPLMDVVQPCHDLLSVRLFRT